MRSGTRHPTHTSPIPKMSVSSNGMGFVGPSTGYSVGPSTQPNVPRNCMSMPSMGISADLSLYQLNSKMISGFRISNIMVRGISERHEVFPIFPVFRNESHLRALDVRQNSLRFLFSCWRDLRSRQSLNTYYTQMPLPSSAIGG